MSVKPALLQSLPLFSDLPEQDVEWLAAAALHKKLGPGEVLAHAGESLNHLIFVCSGCLQAHEISEDGRVVGIGRLKAGDALGWLPLIDGQPLTASVNALEATHVLAIPMPIAQRLVLTKPVITERLLKLLAKHLRSSLNEKALLSLPNAYQRVFMQINKLSGKTAQSEFTLSNLPKQQELASIANTSRETVSRALQLLMKNGILAKAGHNIVIKQADALNKLAYEGPSAIKALKDQL